MRQLLRIHAPGTANTRDSRDTEIILIRVLTASLSDHVRRRAVCNSPRTRGLVSAELARAVALGMILVLAGFVRVIAFGGGLGDGLAISASLFIIVSTSVILGTLLPLLLQSLRIDAAHASTTIQVIMDVMGVLITCTVAPIVFAALSSGSVAPLALG